MCSKNQIKHSTPKDSTDGSYGDAIQEEDVEEEYYQLENGKPNTKETPSPPRPQRTLEKVLFVLVTVTVVCLSHMVVWAQWTMPIFYTSVTPIVIIIRAYNYWRYKWQYFLIDFCYFANALTLVYLWLFPGDELLFRLVFALTNGPILVAAVVYRNSLVFHHHDKVTSVYIHLLPALTTFCIRWYPVETSWRWVGQFVAVKPELSLITQYAVPFGFFFLHSLMYCLVVNVVARPKDPYLTSYSYLAEKYDRLNCINGPMGQGIAYYGFNYLFCLSSLGVPLLSFMYFPVHCATIAIVFVAVVWNGASYYMHVFSERGFQSPTSDE